MTARAFILLRLSVSAFFHRLRHDLAQEIVVALSSLIILATFFYVFNDFLNVEVASLSPTMRAVFARVAGFFALAGASVWAGKLIKSEYRDERTLSSFARISGEDARGIAQFRILHSALNISWCHGLGWWINQRWLYRLDLQTTFVAEAAMLGLTALLALTRQKKAATPDAPEGLWSPIFARKNVSITTVLVGWRLLPVVWRHPLSRLCLLMGGLLEIPLIWAGLKGAPPFAAASCGLAAGFVASMALVFFLAEDIGQAWTERGAGVSHRQFVLAYEGMSWGIGGCFATLSAVLYGVTAIIGAAHASELSAVGKVFCITILPFIAAPWLMFQIDARRPWITATISLLVSLFIGTAILASWLSIMLVPLLRYYGLQSQNGRFYRA